MGISPGTWTVAVSAIVIGLAIGFALQRGRFCMNTAFRDIIFINDVTLFRAYLIALVITMVGANFLEDMHWLGSDQYGPFTLARQSFAPVANIVGGYIFGLGMVLASGCGSGILYRVGEGLISALLATLAFAMGIIMTTSGVLKPVYLAMKHYTVNDASGNALTLYGLFGGGDTTKWILIGVIAVIAGIYVLKGKPFQKGPAKGYKWSIAGVLIGVVATAGWWASGVFGGYPRGISFTGPLGEFANAVLNGNSHSSWPMFSFGHITATWSAIYILAVPIGAYLSSKGLKEFKLNAPPAKDLATVFGGGLLMGFGASVAGG
ncbi:MAG: YeeE/YedE family protein [Nitrospiraceae bacterium]|nr:YeeE/YedE family protein [Nitrospiraceae bacterium]